MRPPLQPYRAVAAAPRRGAFDSPAPIPLQSGRQRGVRDAAERDKGLRPRLSATEDEEEEEEEDDDDNEEEED